MNLVVPMAGRGLRFANQGIAIPKPLIQVAGRPMIAWALQSVAHIAYSRIIFIVLSEHEATYGVTGLLCSIVGPHAKVVLLNSVTEGQLCSVMGARKYINTDEDLLIASSDTYVVSKLGQDIAERHSDSRGIISVTDMPGDNWSFARIDKTGQVVEVAEKVRISDYASTGLYYFTSGREFVEAADETIRNVERTRGEYYVMSVYEKYIQRRWRVEISPATEMWDMGTPEALTQFESHLAPNSLKAGSNR